MSEESRSSSVAINTPLNLDSSSFVVVMIGLNRLQACVLCGGQSRRMGRDKALLPSADGGVWLTALIARLRSMDLAVVVVTGHRDHQACVRNWDGVTLFQEPPPWKGPLQALSHVLPAESGYPLLVLPVDMPCLTADVLRQLIEAWKRDPFLAAVADDGRICQPLLGVYPSGPPFQPSLAEQLKRDDYRWQNWLKRIPHERVLLPSGALLNANAPEDLASFSR